MVKNSNHRCEFALKNLDTNKMANEIQTYDTIVMFGAFFFGLLFLILSMMTFNKIKSNCRDKKVRVCFTTIMCLGAALTASSASYYFCVNNSGDCYGSESGEAGTLGVFFSIFFLILIGAIICCCIILTEYKKMDNDQEQACSKHEGRSYAIAILSFSILLLVGIIVYGGINAKTIFARMTGQREEGIEMTPFQQEPPQQELPPGSGLFGFY